VLFVIGACVLVCVSASGASLGWLYAALSFFGVVSAVFVGRQLLHGPRPGPWLIPTGAALSLLGLVTLASYPLLAFDALPLVGTVLLVLGLGWLVEAWRTASPEAGPRSTLVKWGFGSICGTGVLTAVAVVGLGSATGTGFILCLILLGAALFVVLPIGLNLLSEYGLRLLSELRRRHARAGRSGPARLIVPAGILILVLAALFVARLALADRVLTAIVMAFVILLIVAIVSNTHADVAMVLASLALIGAAPPAQPVPGELTNVGSNTVVVLGDSYVSGEGASKYFAGTNDAGANQCRRAPSAYGVGIATVSHRFDQVVFLACSGARTYNVIGAEDGNHTRVQTGEPGTQIEQIKKLKQRNPEFRPALVLVGLGGNDAGFGTLGEMCLAPGDCSKQRRMFEDNLPDVERALRATFGSLKRVLPGVPILAIPYPQPIADRKRCDGIALTRSERDFIRGFVDKLDGAMQSAATSAGIGYVAAMKDSLQTRNLQLCAVRKSAAGINFVDVLSVDGLASQRFNPTRWIHNSLHPNERGHAAMRDALVTWLDDNRFSLNELADRSGEADGGTPTAPGEAVTEPDPPCTMTVPGDKNCQVQARRWEIRQLTGHGRVMLIGAWLGLVLVWVASMAVLSLCRRRPAASG
jgi:lysophospholipase L1-like esterase